MTDYFHKILLHLYKNADISIPYVITPFLKDLLGPQSNDPGTLQKVATAFGLMTVKGYIGPGSIPILGRTGNGYQHNTLDDHPNITVVLSHAGQEYIGQKLHEDREIGLLERQTLSVEATNDLSRDVFTSTMRLNDEIIPNFNAFQKRSSIITLVVAGLSLVAIGFSAYYSSKGVTSADIESLKRQLQSNTSILDSMQRSQRGIDSSLRKAVKDSFSGKRP